MPRKIKPVSMDDAYVERVRCAIDEALPHLEPLSEKYKKDPTKLRRKRDSSGQPLLKLAESE